MAITLFEEDFQNFTGSGFVPEPTAGQLDSDLWRITGLSDGVGSFGGTFTTGDFARGLDADGGVTTGGIYAFQTSGNTLLGIQPGGSDFTPGTITLNLLNTTDSTLTGLDIAYDIFFNNDQPRANSLNFAYSTDDVTYTLLSGLNFTTPEAADAEGFQSESRSATITGLNIAAGGEFFLQWQGDDVSGSDSRDEYGIDNVLITTTNGNGGGPTPSFVEDFNTFTGSGFTPNPGAGQLDSDAWSVTGLSDGDLTFGGTQISGDFARGSSTGGVSTGGIYGFEVEPGNNILGVQPTGSDFTPGEFVLKLQNDGTSTVTEVDVDYVIRFLNDQGRANSLNFSYSEDGNSFTDLSDLDFTTPESSDSSGWQSVDRSATLTGLDIAPEEFFFLKWTGNDVSGGGSRDEYGIDDIQVTNLVAADGDNNGGGDPGDIIFIHEVQGSGASSPIEGQTVTIEAVVVGDFQDGASGTNGDLNGFFVQEEDTDADDDPLTSEGLFIFDGSSPALDVNIGDVVQVTGTVSEFFGMTQLSSSSVTIVGTDSLPTPATVNLPAAGSTTNSEGDFIADLEQFEGMGVTVPDKLFVTEYFNLDRFGEVVLSSNGLSNEDGTDGRLDQYTDFNNPDINGFAAYQEEIGKRRIVLDDGQTVQNPNPIILGRGGNPLSATNTLRGGDTIENLSGVLNFSFNEYRVQPIGPVDFQPTNPRPATPEDVGGDLTVASFNVLNFFTTLDVPGNPGSGPNGLAPRGADSQTEFDRQIEKLVTTLEIIDADIFGLIELENEYGDQNGDGQFAIGTLVDALNNRVGAGTYAFVDPGVPFGDTGDAITVGAIYKTETVQIAPGTTVEFLTDSDLPSIGLSGRVFDGADTNRAPMAVTFEEISSGETFTVSVNHFKSKGGSGSGDDADIGDGQGNFNGTRLRGAQAVDAWLDSDPTGSGDEDFLIIGDLNAYAQEDPITFLESQGYTDLIEEFVGNDAYSFVFDGQFGYLDLGLANTTLVSQVTGTTEWHINADEPDAFDYNLDFGRDPSLFNGQDPFRTSDHDPVIIGLDLFSEAEEPNVIEGTRNDDNIRGTDGNDLIFANNGNDIVNALDGDDTVEGGRGGDIIRGGNGDDVLAADRVDRFQDFDGEVSEIRGGAGNDTIYGGSKNDLLIGGAGDDTIFGKSGDDEIRGTGGNDLLNGGIGNDFINGAQGNDTADYSDLVINGVFGTIAGLDAILPDQTARHSSTNNALTWTDTLVNIENVIGTQRNDRFFGNAQDNLFDGQGEVGRSDRQTVFVDRNGVEYRVTGDVVEYKGSQSDFTFAGDMNEFTVSSGSRNIGVDTLKDIEFLRFNGDDTVVATTDLTFA